MRGQGRINLLEWKDPDSSEPLLNAGNLHRVVVGLW